MACLQYNLMGECSIKEAAWTSNFCLQVMPSSLYDSWIFVQVATFNTAVNQTWIALVTFLIMFTPTRAHQLSPIISGIVGSTEGFFIINPAYQCGE